MITLNQEVDTANVRTESHNGREHLVAPITILKPMVLNTPEGEAYLPEQEAKKSALAWNGEPLTLNHPAANDGTPTTANSPQMVENVKLGTVYNAEYTDGAVKAEAWFDIERIEDMGGPALEALNRVRNGDTVEVSSGYQADVAKNQQADGKARDKIQGNIRPDHVAVLPNDTGKCSVRDGCGVGVAANSTLIMTNAQHTLADGDIVEWDDGAAMGQIVDLREEGEPAYDDEIDGDVVVEPAAALIEIVEEVDGELVPQDTMVAHKTDTDTLSLVENPPELADNTTGDSDDGENPEDSGMNANYLSDARTPDFDGTETTSWGDVPKTLSHWVDALGVEAESVDEMTAEQKQAVANHTLLGDPEADTWQELSFFPVVNPSTSNLNAGALRAVISGRGESQESVPESAEDSAQEMARSLLEDEFDSENSGHMDGEEEDEMSANIFQRAWDRLVGNEPAESGVDNSDMSDTNCECEGDTPATNDDEVIEVAKSDLDELIDERVEERLAANKEAQTRDELVETITANSEDYTEESLSETPVDVLENIAANVQGGVDFGGARGASPKPATNTEDVDTDIKLFGGDD